MEEDHPRVCGEKKTSTLEWRFLGGSPPRVRGKVRVQKPLMLSIVDHPRVCGEKFFGNYGGNYAKGSPPRVRGKALSPFV